VAKRDGWACHYCGTPVWCSGPGCNPAGPPTGFLPGEMATADHVVPFCLGGSDNIDNQVLACWDCNQDKGEQTVEQWLGLLPDTVSEPPCEPEPERELPDLDTGLDTLRAMWNGRRSD
jgi:hypothetical protein